MKDIGNAFGSTNADPDMLTRLPMQNLDMLAAMHLSPTGLKLILEKMNLLGLANLGLSSEGFSVDDILDAYTGDLAFVMNDFNLRAEKKIDTFMGQAVEHQNIKPSLSMSFVVKINKKENFRRIVKKAKEKGLQQSGNGFAIPLDEKDTVYILMNDQYMVVSNKYANADGILKGDFKSQKLPEIVSSQVVGHPWGLYLDVQQFCKNIDPQITPSAKDSVMLAESKKLLNNISVSGGTFKDNAFTYHLDVNFMNADENSIINLMNFVMEMNETSKMGGMTN